MDLGFFLELSEENKIIYNQKTVNSLIEEMEKSKMAFLRKFFSL